VLATSATKDLITNTKRCSTLGVGYQIFCGGVCQQRLVLVIKSVAEFASNAWCWLSNLWRSLPTTLGVG
jgi:hypothetical protein